MKIRQVKGQAPQGVAAIKAWWETLRLAVQKGDFDKSETGSIVYALPQLVEVAKKNSQDYELNRALKNYQESISALEEAGKAPELELQAKQDWEVLERRMRKFLGFKESAGEKAARRATASRKRALSPLVQKSGRKQGGDYDRKAQSPRS